MKALQAAAEAGRADVHAHFAGGFKAWAAAGEPVEEG
jgi:rhodanese-related sulfurtransferase